MNEPARFHPRRHDIFRVWSTAMTRTHQPGQAAFKSVPPEDIEWEPFPAFPPSVRLAVIVGQPSEPGPYVIRVKVPSEVKLAKNI